MLDFIRKHQKWMLVFVIILVVPSFVFLGVANYQGMLSNDAPLAQVKDQKSRVTSLILSGVIA